MLKLCITINGKQFDKTERAKAIVVTNLAGFWKKEREVAQDDLVKSLHYTV